MDRSEIDKNPKSRLNALKSLGQNTGWEIYRRRFREIVKLEFDKKIFDTDTPEAERTILVKARKVISDSYTPEKMRQALVTTAEGEARRVDRG